MQQLRCSQYFLALMVLACAGTRCAAQQAAQTSADLKNQRADFQSQEIITGKSQSWILNAGQTPRLIWRDVDRVRELGFTEPFRVRWFNARLEEADAPAEPGRWAAWIEGTAPNGTPFRRAKTFYVIPPQPVFFPPEVTVSLPDLPDTPDGRIWKQHAAEFNRVAKDALGRSMLNDEMSAILLAGLAEATPLDHPARFVDSTDVRNQDFHLALKLKLMGLADQTRPLAPPRRRTPPALELREGTPAEAGVAPDAAERIHAVCQAWVEDTREPFVTLVARHGVIVLHRAYGHDPAGTPVDLSYRCWVASITKTVTALMFARFADQGLADLDDSLSKVFPDYPQNDPHVPTFRQCMNHTSGLAGSPDFGGFRNPHLENVILNGIDVNEPESQYAYSGLGFELTAQAMSMITGLSAPRVYHRHLFEPLGFGDVIMGNGGSDGEFTAWELGVLAQLVCNRGSYGDIELFSEATFERLLPQPLTVPGQGTTTEGIGLHWRLAGTDGYSEHTVGHGSFSGCVFTIDLDRGLVIAQVRRNSGDRSGEWVNRFFRTISEVVVD